MIGLHKILSISVHAGLTHHSKLVCTKFERERLNKRYNKEVSPKTFSLASMLLSTVYYFVFQPVCDIKYDTPGGKETKEGIPVCCRGMYKVLVYSQWEILT